MTAHWIVLAAAALTTLVAGAAGGTLAVFAGQALPLAVRHDLSVAPGTALSVTSPVSGGQAGPAGDTLRTAITRALGKVPFEFWSASWSDPLGLVPGSLPARPASVGQGNIPLLEAAAMDGVTTRAVLVSGKWPSAPTPASSKRGIPAALPVTAATLLHLEPGDVLTFRDRITGARDNFRITGLFAPRRLTGTAASYWRLNSIPASGSATLSGFTTYGPLLVSPAAFATAKLTTNAATWLAQPDMGKFTDTDLSAVAGDVAALQGGPQNSSTLSDAQLSTSLPSVLNAAASNLSVARSLLVISALQLLVLAFAALLATSRLLVTQREGETALLTSRGASRWQLTRLTASETVPLCGAAALAGGLIGIRLAALLAGTGALRDAGIRLPGSVLLSGGGVGSAAGTWLDAAAAAVIVAAVAICAMLAPGLASQASAGHGAATARVRRGRQAAIAGATRAGADLALIVLAVLAGWELRRYSAASGTNTVDPVLALAPALALAGGTILALRLLPVAARAGNRLAARGRRLTASLAGWQVSRQPLRQGGAALLLVMAVATGTLALAQHASWARSASDQATATAGADVRIDTPAATSPAGTAAITSTPGVTSAMAVSVQQTVLPAEILAIDAARAPDVVRLRRDQSALPPNALFSKITPARSGSTPVPGHPDAISLTAALGPATRATEGLGPVTVSVTVADSTGSAYQLSAGTLPADGRRHVLTAPLGGTRASFPLRLLQISLNYTLPTTRSGAGPVTLSVTTPAALSGWTADASSPELQTLQGSGGLLGGSSLPGATHWEPAGNTGSPAGNKDKPAGDTATLTFSPGYGLADADPGSAPPEPVSGQVMLNASVPAAPLPAIATDAFLNASEAAVGSVVQANIGGAQVPLRIVASTESFPTVPGGGLIVDLSALQDVLLARNGFPLPVTEWWLSTSDHEVPPVLARALPPGSAVTGAAQVTAQLTGDPLSAIPQQALLALAAAAALLAITGFWVSIAADTRQRRAEHALLAALGVAQRSAALQLCLEKLLLSVPSAAIGACLGGLVAQLLVPAVTLTAGATRPIPPPVTLFALPQVIALAAVVAVLPALTAAFIMFRRPDPAAELRAAEAA